jgi:phosphate transport system permease protein
MRAGLTLLGLLALVPLVLVLYDLIRRGRAAIGSGFFSTDPTGSFLGGVGGVRSAVFGSLELTLLATLISAPVGVGIGLVVARGSASSRPAQTVARAIAQLAAVPPIVIGLFIYATLVVAGVGGGFAGWKGALALALVMLAPIAGASARAEHRGDRLAGVLLAAARGIGEAAPLLFTAAGPDGLTFNPAHPMNSLPVQIFSDLGSPRAAVVHQAWAAGLTLVLIVAILVVLARLAAGRRTRAGVPRGC